MYLSYFGLRVRDLPRSIAFYAAYFGLRPMAGASVPATSPSEATGVVLVDPVSSQRIELNYYPPGNPYAVPYAPGEGWDHLAFRVDDLEKFLERLRSVGIAPKRMRHYDGPYRATPQYRVAYVDDPDGNEIEVYDTPGGDPARFDRDSY